MKQVVSRKPEPPLTSEQHFFSTNFLDISPKPKFIKKDNSLSIQLPVIYN